MQAPSWFQKLRSRRKRRKKGKQSPCRSPPFAAAATTTSASAACTGRPSSQCRPPVAPPPARDLSPSPNRASYYFPTADRARQDRGLRCVVAADGDRALDVRVDVVHRRAGDRRLGGLDAPPGTPELKLRPIVTRSAARSDPPPSDDGGGCLSSATTSAATTPSTRARGFHVKPSRGRRSGRRRSCDHDGYSKNKEEKAAPAAPVQEEHGGREAAAVAVREPGGGEGVVGPGAGDGGEHGGDGVGQRHPVGGGPRGAARVLPRAQRRRAPPRRRRRVPPRLAPPRPPGEDHAPGTCMGP
ncbi:hypothetical protein ACP70R_012417 [Stipagrostis hirtigluma subsp. patula]